MSEKNNNVEEINFQRRSRCALFDRMGVFSLRSLSLPLFVDRSLISFIFTEPLYRGGIRTTNINFFHDAKLIFN